MKPKIGSTLLVVALAGCGSSGNTPSVQQVGTAGGALTASDGTKLDFPMGALSSDTAISMTKTSNVTAPASNKVVGTAYTFGPEGTQFAKPVGVTLVVSPNQLPKNTAMSSVVIYTAPAGTTDYVPLETTVVDATHVRASTMHFSVFVPAVVAAVESHPDAGSGGDMVSEPQPDAGPGGGGSCVPTCVTTTDGGCACTATCNGHQYSLGGGATGVVNCNIDGQTTKSIDASCSDGFDNLKRDFFAPVTQNGCGFPSSSA
jgi:hypothetical protein